MPAEPSDVATTRTAYDTVAEDYAALLRGSVAASPYERGALDLFAGAGTAPGGGPVADLGCGSGRLTGHLRDLGLDLVGVDLSPAMVAIARREHPEVPVAVGSLGHLPLATGSLAGALAWYSLIHTPTERLAAVFAEVHRVLRPGAPLLVGFQVGDEVRGGRRRLYGHDLELDSYRRPPDLVTGAAGAAGFTEVARAVHPPEPPYDCPQAHLLLRR
jgi:SAM-dependent methyltransferase